MIENMIHWGGEGPVLHLAHANSFHPGTYQELIENLKTQFSVYSVLMKPFHQNASPDDLHSWTELRDELIQNFDVMGWKNVVGLGHSLGSTVTMMASVERPDLFSKLVIIEPPCINPLFFRLMDILPYSILKNMVPPSKIALRRRHKWPSREQAFQLFRRKKVFDKWSDNALRAYVEYGLSRDEDGEFRLTFSKFWESKIYCTIENPYKLISKLTHETLCIRGDDSDVISEKYWKKWQRLQPEGLFVNIAEGGHHVPLEKPLEVGRIVKNFVSTGHIEKKVSTG